MTTKVCTRCEKEKSIEAFRFIRTNKNGTLLYASQCIECKTEVSRERYRNFPKEKRAEIYREKKEKTTFESRKDVRLKYRFGISLEIFNQMLLEQGSICKICEYDITEETARVDHCHKSGKVRALLCHHCNTGIEHFKEDPEILLRAINYLGTHSC